MISSRSDFQCGPFTPQSGLQSTRCSRHEWLQGKCCEAKRFQTRENCGSGIFALARRSPRFDCLQHAIGLIEMSAGSIYLQKPLTYLSYAIKDRYQRKIWAELFHVLVNDICLVYVNLMFPLWNMLNLPGSDVRASIIVASKYCSSGNLKGRSGDCNLLRSASLVERCSKFPNWPARSFR